MFTGHIQVNQVKKILIYLKLGFGLLVFLALINYLDPEMVIAQFAGLSIPWVVAAAIMISLSTTLGTINVHLFVNRDGEVGITKFFPIYWTAWAFSLVIPGQVGDVASLSVMMRRYGIDWHKTLGRSLVDKMISFALMFALAVFGIFSIVSFSSLSTEIYISASIVLAAIISVLFALRKRIGKALAPERPGIGGLIGRAIAEIGVTIRHSPRKVLLNAALTCIKIGLIGGSYWCMFAALGYQELRLDKVIFLTAASSMVAYVPVSINGLGTVEAAGIMLFATLGISKPAIFSAYLALRFIVLALAWVPAGLWLIFRKPR